MLEGQGEYTGDEESTGETKRVMGVNELEESLECITAEHIWGSRRVLKS